MPVSISTAAVGYNIYPLLPLRDLRLSATSVAGLLWQGGQPTSDLLTGSMAADQGGCRPSANRVNVLYTRGGRTETNVTVSSWLHAAWQRRGPGDLPPPPWKYGVIDVLPSIDLAQQENLNAKVPEALVNLKSSEQTAFSFAARFALVDTTWAGDHSVTLASIQNEANSWVQPSTAGALETLKTSTIGADNIVDVDELSKNPLAYPLVTVNYAVAPTTITEDFTATDADAVRRALGFIISTQGQQLAAEEGFVPLTADLTIHAVDAIAKIGSIVPPAPTTTAAPTTAAPTTTAAPAPAPADREGPNPANQPTAAAAPRARVGAQPPRRTLLRRAVARTRPPARRRRPRRAPRQARRRQARTPAPAAASPLRPPTPRMSCRRTSSTPCSVPPPSRPTYRWSGRPGQPSRSPGRGSTCGGSAVNGLLD